MLQVGQAYFMVHHERELKRTLKPSEEKKRLAEVIKPPGRHQQGVNQPIASADAK